MSKDTSTLKKKGMAFVEEMNPFIQKMGVNGAEVFTEAGVGDVRVSLFTMLTRGLGESYIDEQIATASEEHLEDLLLIAMQTRDIRGGKGERALFVAMMSALWTRTPEKVARLVSLVPEYGCWRDMWELWKHIPDLRPNIYAVVKSQWAKDCAGEEKVSLLAKWIPREHSGTWPGLANTLAQVLYPYIPSKARLAHYRKAVAAVNRRLHTAEIQMCGGRWRELEPAHIPGRCFRLQRNALLNKALVKRRRKYVASDEERYDSEDRRVCAKNVEDFLKNVLKGTATIHGADVVQPHELVQDVVNRIEDVEDSATEAQWQAIRKNVDGSFRKIVPMCDFSGSMSGIPMMVSLALGILISETNHSAFRDHLLTFDSVPVWHSLVGLNSLHEKVKSVYNNCGQGCSTDFYMACQMILKRMLEANVPIGEEPEDLVVLTDMGWNAANFGYECVLSDTSWKSSQVITIRDEFAAAGYKAPRIIIWNLRAEYKDFHARAEDDGVVLLSGWSPAILKVLQTGVEVHTPLEGLRAILDAPRYDRVRACIRSKDTPQEKE